MNNIKKIEYTKIYRRPSISDSSIDRMLVAYRSICWSTIGQHSDQNYRPICRSTCRPTLSRLSLNILANMSTESQPTDVGREINWQSADMVTKSRPTCDIGRHVDQVSADIVDRGVHKLHKIP